MDEVGESAIEREDAAGENATGCCAAILDVDGESAELIFAFGHSGGGHGIGDEDGAVGAFRFPPQADDFGIGVDAVADELGVEVVVCEYGAEDAGLAMIEGAHGVEGVCGADRSGGDGGPGFGGGGVGMAHGYSDSA